MLEGCQGKFRTLTIHEKVCPQCGEIVELFSIDTAAACDRCGFVVYNDTLSCVQWCQHARQCVGDEQYEQIQARLKTQKRSKHHDENHYHH